MSDAKWLKSNHLSSPEIYIKDEKYGFLIIEDFGNVKYSVLCKKEKEKKKFYYRQAIKLLILLSEKKKFSFFGMSGSGSGIFFNFDKISSERSMIQLIKQKFPLVRIEKSYYFG